MSSRLVELDACPPLRVELAAGPPLTLAGGRPVNLDTGSDNINLLINYKTHAPNKQREGWMT